MKYQNYNDDELEMVKYGLEGLYLTITKLVVIIGMSLLLKIFWEVISILFIGIPYLLLHVEIPKVWILVSGIVLIISYLLWAPADTVKRPLPNNKKKRIRKIMTIVIGIIYLVLSLVINDYKISILFFITMIIQAIVICPVTYILLRQPYNNYKKVDV